MEATLFLGNGINRISKNPLDWRNLLLGLAKNEHVSLRLEKKPYTMIYEELVLHSTSKNEYSIKEQIQQQLKEITISPLYEELYSLDIKNYITTNYDFSLEKVFEGNGYKRDFKKQETLYSIRTHVTMLKTDRSVNIWHIHGDIDRIASIALGLDQYCGSVGKIDAYLKGNYSYKEGGKEKRSQAISTKLEGRASFDSVSWIELFYNTDIHIFGFGLNFSEIDIWRILNKRQRDLEIKKLPIKNKIYYYDVYYKDEEQQAKYDLLKGFGVEVITVDLKDNDWETATESLLKRMKAKI